MCLVLLMQCSHDLRVILDTQIAVNSLTAGAAYIRVFIFLLAH